MNAELKQTVEQSLKDRLKSRIREVPDFPIKGVLFKDMSPVFHDPKLVREVTSELVARWRGYGITKVIGIESRGFLFGPAIANELNAGFVMVRKKGKLPPDTDEISYSLEYGSATIEVVKDAFNSHDKVLVHDDLLATGGTAAAAAELAQLKGAEVIGFSFLISLSFLCGEDLLRPYSDEVHFMLEYDE